MSNFIFEHRYECMIELAPDADERAPGGAVTVSLCGQWDHEGLCRWPHYSTLEPLADGLSRLVVDFNAAPQDVELVRAKIKAGVETERLIGPDGILSKWRVCKKGEGSA